MLRPIALSLAAFSATALAGPAQPSAAPTPFPSSEANGTTFRVRVENVSTEATLKLSSGGTAPAPTAPVLWVVHTSDNPVFTGGEKDRGLGLESLAEDGSPVKLAEALSGKPGIVSVGAVAVPVGATEPGPLLPGSAYEFEVTAETGQRLTLVFMFAQSNDLFYAPRGEGIRLFDDGSPVSGDLTSKLRLWDAGTEVNQEPGAGANQAPRQAGPNTGPSEGAPVRLAKDAKDGFSYPAVDEVVRVTLHPVSSGR